MPSDQVNNIISGNKGNGFDLLLPSLFVRMGGGLEGLLGIRCYTFPTHFSADLERARQSRRKPEAVIIACSLASIGREGKKS